MRLLVLGACALTPVAAGCGGDEQDYDTELAGIYQITSWTHNPDGCAEEGPPVEGSPISTHFYVRSDVFLGVPFVGVSTCRSLDECRTWSTDYDTVFNLSFRLDAGSDQEGWTGYSTEMTAGRDGDRFCEGAIMKAVLGGRPGDQVRIEEETKTVTDVPIVEGEIELCDYEFAYRRADQLPCEQLTVVTGTWLEGI
jgi:hypothetical protein